MLLLLFFLLLFYLLISLILLLYISYRVAKPPWHQPSPKAPVHPATNIPDSWYGALHPTDLSLPFTTVSFPTHSGLTLRGWLIPSSTPTDTAIICVHGAGRDCRAFLRHAQFLHRAGFDCLLFDCSNHGLSDRLPPWPFSPWPGRAITLGRRESKDVAAAVDYIKSKGKRRVVVLATSQGATSAILASALYDAADVLVLENPFESPTSLVKGLVDSVFDMFSLPSFSWLKPAIVWLALFRTGNLPESKQLCPQDYVAKLKVPILFIHGTADFIVNYRQSERLFKRVSHHDKRLLILRGAKHTHCHHYSPEIFQRTVLKFLYTYLR